MYYNVKEEYYEQWLTQLFFYSYLRLSATLTRHANAAGFWRTLIPVPEVFLYFSPHDKAARELQSGEHKSRLGASRKEEKSRETTGTRVENVPQTREIWERRLGVLMWTKEGAFRRHARDHQGERVKPPPPTPLPLIMRFCSNTKSKMTIDCLRRSVERKHLMRFQSDNAVFKFLRRSIDGVCCSPE